MRYLVIISFLLAQFYLPAQDVECDGSFYLIISYDSDGSTDLYKIDQKNDSFTFNLITLSENRRLAGLAYNTSDLHLWAMDVDNFEMVRINSSGSLQSMGRIENIDEDLEYSSGMMSPTGKEYYFMGYNKAINSAIKFYEIDISKDNFFAEFDDISSSRGSRILDMTVDPIFGAVYGYNNLNGTIVQFGIDGQIATISQSRRDEQSIGALFYSREGQLYGYTPKGEMYAIDNIEGNLRFLQRGPQGDRIDGCGCPYTSEFSKRIVPRQIIPCEPFDVKYTFRNNLGISQTQIHLRDTFPEGFEVINISSSIPYTRAESGIQKNILALNDLIYHMGGNTFIVTFQPSDSYFGPFASRARQEPFPKALASVQFSDDPETDDILDPTMAEIISENDISLRDHISFSCDGKTATIRSPVNADHYEWSTGETDVQVEVNAPGWYTLKIENECFSYLDSVQVNVFPEEKAVSLGADKAIVIGDSVLLTPILDRGDPALVEWYENGMTIDCENCGSLWLSPEADSYIRVMVTDQEGCLTEDEVFIQVEYEKKVYIPNVFSPNGDGINDNFYISSAVPGRFKLSVYNRWGNLVFEQPNGVLSENTGGWDGIFNGDYISSGSYIWVAEIEYVSGEKETLHGDFLVIAH